MAKKQQIILTHGTSTPSADVVKGLKLGEVLVQHAAEAKDAALHTALKEFKEAKEGQEGQEAVIVSFPSKEWVSARIAELKNEDTQDAINDLDERLTAAESNIEALQAEDADIRKDFADEDTAIRGEFAAADNVVRGEFAAADKTLKEAYEAADNALDEKIATNAGEITKLQAADTKIREEFATADATLKSGYETADAALKSAYEAADATLKSGYETADAALEEKINTNADKIADLEAADTAMEDAYKAADEVVRGEFAAEDAEIRKEFAAADKTLKEAYEAADELLDERLGKIEGKDAGMSMREVAVDELAKQLIPEGAKEAMDTLEELAAWLQQHPEDAAAMNTAIAKNASDIAALDAAYKAADTSLNERLTTAENDIDALEAADTTIRGEFADADTQIRKDFADADTQIRKDFADADTQIRKDFADADEALNEKIVELQANYVKEVVANGKTYKPVENVLDLSEMVIDGGEY